MDTQQYFRFWAKECRETEEDGLAVLYGREFCDDLDKIDPDMIDRDHPKQPFAFIASTQKIISPVLISYAHSMTRGSGSGIKGLDKSIGLPCLITNALDTVGIFDAAVSVELTQVARKIFENNRYCHDYPVESDDWFGILTLLDEGKLHLTAFSVNPSAEVKAGQEIRFTEWDDQLACGVIL